MDSKRTTSAQRLDGLESKVEAIDGSLAMIEESNTKILELLNTPSEAPERLNYQTSEKTNESIGRVTATNIEKSVTSKIGCFEVLDALLKQFPTKVTVSAPHIKKDGTKGKSYILNMPRIDKDFALVNHDDTSEAQQIKEAKSLWKAVAFNGYMFTGKYFKKDEGVVFTTCIKTNNEAVVLKFLEKNGVHIPKRD